MVKKRAEKKTEVEKLNAELLQTSSLILSSFQGLKVSQDNDLRRAIEKVGGRYRVVKNTLVERAARGTAAADLLKGLTGTNSIAYTQADAVQLAKALTKYARDNPAFSFKAGLIEGRVVSLQEIQQLATLPSREELMAKLLYLISSPARRLAGALQGVSRNLAVVVKQAVEEKKFAG
ncbi:MAG TPA: 50S ribosomal protein L10 [Candidatus Acidoferrales bacterium]